MSGDELAYVVVRVRDFERAHGSKTWPECITELMTMVARLEYKVQQLEDKKCES